MTLTTWTIEADDRERAGGVVEALAAYPQVVVAVGRLPLGDYLPGGGVVVERKTAADLVQSIRDRRFFDQAARLREGAAHPVLILEGDPLAVRTGMHKNAILGALTWLTTIQGIPLSPSTGPARTAALLVTIARQQQQGWRAPSGVVKPKAPTVREQRLAVPAALPGVGPYSRPGSSTTSAACAACSTPTSGPWVRCRASARRWRRGSRRCYAERCPAWPRKAPFWLPPPAVAAHCRARCLCRPAIVRLQAAQDRDSGDGSHRPT